MKDQSNRFFNTAAALADYDAKASERKCQLNISDSDEALITARVNEEAAVNRVREAFWQDTQDITTRESCMLKNIEFLRRMAELGSKSQKVGKKLGRRIIEGH